MTYEKTAIEDLLKNNVLNVVFTKKDGTQRTMRCTLQESLLPKKELKEGEETPAERKKSETSVAVFDLEKNDWRAFRLDSIIDVQIENTAVVAS